MENILQNIKLKLLILAVSVMILAMFPSAASADGCTPTIVKTMDPTSGGLGSHVNVTLYVTAPCDENVTVVDTLPKGFTYIGNFTVNGTVQYPEVEKGKITYVIDGPEDCIIKFEVKVTEAKSWEVMQVVNVATATNASGVQNTSTAYYDILPFEELHKNVGIPKADVVFAIDLTGSMLPEIDTIKANATDIMNDLAAQIADVQFGLITFMDYDGFYTTNASGYWYNATYGNATINGDYPYKLDQNLTNNITAMNETIDALVNGWGGDGPQDYTRIIHESYNDTNISWRPNATRFLILFGDNVPHDTNFDINNDGTPDNRGGDPGRDTILGTGDDLNFEDEVANASNAGIHILGVYNGSLSTKYPWTYMADETSGRFFNLSEAEDIPDAINEMMKAEAQETLTIEQMTETQWAVIIDVVNPFDYTMTDVVIKDRFGGEIEIDDCNLSTPEIDECNITHGTWSYYTKGKSKKVFLEWDIGDLLQGETARLILLVSTDLNPASKKEKIQQEYTSPGVYELNSGATLKFIDPTADIQLSAYTDNIYVIVEE